jgi:hypothetical protein
MLKPKKKYNTSLFSYERFSITLIWLGGVVMITFFILLVSDALWFHFLTPDQDARLGNMGQLMEGTVGSLWALAGVILVYEALRFQRMELKSQRHEFELNRQEVIEQTQQFKAQNLTMAIQTFENTFFQLILLHNEIVNSLAIERLVEDTSLENKKILKGRKCFRVFYQHFKNFYYNTIDLIGMATPDQIEMAETLNETFLQFYVRYQDDLGHYLRNIDNIINVVDKSDMKNKQFYAHMFQDHLTNYELLILFYYCFSDYGITLKPLVEKYRFFEHLIVEELLDRRHKDFYKDSAF